MLALRHLAHAMRREGRAVLRCWQRPYRASSTATRATDRVVRSIVQEALDTEGPFLEEVVIPAMSLVASVTASNEAARILAARDHSLAAFMVVRSQLEAFLSLFYVLEPMPNIAETHQRVSDYLDWAILRSKANFEKSMNWEALAALPRWKRHQAEIQRLYDLVAPSYEQSELKKLQKSTSFLGAEKKKVAERANIVEMYDHLQATGSESLHCADHRHRLARHDHSTGALYKINVAVPGTWPVYWASMLQALAIVSLACLSSSRAEVVREGHGVFIQLGIKPGTLGNTAL